MRGFSNGHWQLSAREKEQPADFNLRDGFLNNMLLLIISASITIVLDTS
jgi:hypothetical protein